MLYASLLGQQSYKDYSVASSVNLIYGSFATSVVALISIEAIAVIILLGAQVIAELERRNSSSHDSTGR